MDYTPDELRESVIDLATRHGLDHYPLSMSDHRLIVPRGRACVHISGSTATAEDREDGQLQTVYARIFAPACTVIRELREVSEWAPALMSAYHEAEDAVEGRKVLVPWGDVPLSRDETQRLTTAIRTAKAVLLDEHHRRLVARGYVVAATTDTLGLYTVTATEAGAAWHHRRHGHSDSSRGYDRAFTGD